MHILNPEPLIRADLQLHILRAETYPPILVRVQAELDELSYYPPGLVDRLFFLFYLFMETIVL